MQVKEVVAFATLTIGLISSASITSAADGPATAPEAEQPNIHGFVNVPFKTAYITPRGLVVEDQGLVIQPIGGLVLPLNDTFTVIGGVWNSINTNQDDPSVGAYNEIDPFVELSAKIDKFELSATYVPFISPPDIFKTEHNTEYAIKYSDDWFGDFTINPYAKFFYAMSGDSTVVLGRKGNTYDIELGAVPSYTFGKGTDAAVTLSLPTFVTVGPKNFWGADQNVGVFSTGLTATVPLSFIPARYGHWHAGIGVTYYYLINDNLVEAADLVGSGRDRSRFVGSVEIGFSF